MLHGFSDSDWAGSAQDRKSTSGICFSLGSAMVSWLSRKHGSIGLSTAKAEYISAIDVVGHNTHTEKGGESVCGHFYQFFALFPTTSYNQFLSSIHHIS